MPDSTDDDTFSNDFEKHDITRATKRNDQLARPRIAQGGFATRVWRPREPRESISNRVQRPLRRFPVWSLALQLALNREVLETLQVLESLLQHHNLEDGGHEPAGRDERRLAVSNFACSEFIASSTDSPPPSTFHRAMAASPRLTNSDCARRQAAAATTASSINSVSDSPSRNTASTSARTRGSTRMGGKVADLIGLDCIATVIHE